MKSMHSQHRWQDDGQRIVVCQQEMYKGHSKFYPELQWFLITPLYSFYIRMHQVPKSLC